LIKQQAKIKKFVRTNHNAVMMKICTAFM